MADNMSYLYTIGGYATIFGIGYILYHVSTQQKGKKRATVAPLKQVKPSVAEPRKEDRKKKQRRDNFTSEAQNKPAPKPVEETSQVPQTRSAKRNESSDDGADNREFAKQLSKAKEGTKFAASKEGAKQREKSVKQSRANKITPKAEEKVSAPSSTTGAEADDDQSPITSPEVAPAVAGDVSDMLEPVTSAPSILRITDTAEKKKNKKPAKAEEVVETKKQRQNRKKAEAAKAARDEAEKDRKVLEEKQRRQARIAEGRAAKDGSQFMANQAQTPSRWAQGAPAEKAAPVAATNGFHAPLDTLEKPASKPAEKTWISSLPSEEEQIEMLKSDDDEWSTVKTKSSKKAAAKADSSSDSADDRVEAKRPALAPVSSTQSKPAQSFGSFSALSTKNAPAEEEEEEEEEWDV